MDEPNEQQPMTEGGTNERSPQETSTMPTIGQLSVAFGILLLVFGASYIPDLLPERERGDLSFDEELEDERSTKGDARMVFDTLELEAESIYIHDAATGKAIYNKNGGVQLPLASLTKLMTALVAYEHLRDDALVTITLDAILQEGESGFEDGEYFVAKDLIDYTLMTSSNDGAYALAAAAGYTINELRDPEEAFIEEMNRKAEEIGLVQSYFDNPTGLDASDLRSGSYGSARDMAHLMEYMVRERPEVLTRTTETGWVLENGSESFTASNTNAFVGTIPGIIGSKTGYTDLAGGNLVVAYDAGLNHPVVISVLGSTYDGRFTDVLKLIDATEAYILHTP